MATVQQLLKKCMRQKKTVKSKRLALGRCPQKRGTCTKVYIMTPRKPCSARRPFARVKLSNKIMATCHIPGERHNLKKFSTVLVRGGRPNDIPGVKYKIIRGARFPATYNAEPVYQRKKARSKYGVGNVTRKKRIRARENLKRDV